MGLQLRYVAHSEIGLIRKNNQDSGYASPHLLVVADGMGGAAAGDLASAVAIDTISQVDSQTGGEVMLEALAGAVHRANDRIADLVEADRTLDGMGTTVTGALFDGTELGLVHIGDSRAYLMRDGVLRQLTHDHSWVQSLVDEGKISAGEAATHPHRSLLLKVLNGQTPNDPDLAVVPLRAGDRLMFCSDGVCGLIDDDAIQAALALPELADAQQQLVDEALAEGGIDNITVIVADLVDGEGTAEAVLLGAAAERAQPPSEPADAGQEPARTEIIEGAPRPAPADGDQPAVADEERYRPQARQRRWFVRPLILLLIVLLVVGAGLGAAYAWTRTQFFIGAAGDKVAIYQGLSDGLPGISLSKVYEVQPLQVSALPPYYQDKVRSTIDVANLDAARQTVTELADAARRCAGQQGTPSASPSPSPTAKPSGKPSAKPSSKPSPSSGSTAGSSPELAC